MPSALMLINPISGTRDKKGLCDFTASRLKSAGIDVEIAHTQHKGHGAELANRAAQDGRDIVVVAGGDGTVNEVASALMHTDTALGIIPCGSGNGLARSLGIPMDFDGAVDVIARNRPYAIDCGLAEGLPFFCTFGVGFDAVVTEKFSTGKRRGKMQYVRSALLEYINFTPDNYALEIDGEIYTENAILIAVCNTSQYGNNAYIAPRASLSDGLLDVTVIRNGSILQQAIAGIGLLSGQIDRNRFVDTFKAKEVKIVRLKEGPAQIDGEPLNLGRKISIKCQPSCLRVLCDGSEPEFQPIITPMQAFFNDMISDLRYLTRPLPKS
ncbi:MAG: diacylglycerol kinase family lipid kinase [Muribaculaceae bacterium]|nr:diacylglycerol kinase family lipid kinase [Muribaculaceae bacterium]MDE6522077.1 diacylglycerol kinase family lipid kinase [Muribaculaceae bacterium]